MRTVVVRLAGDDVDGAARGVAAEQGALRALQYLDPLDVEEGSLHADDVRIDHPVDVNANRRIVADLRAGAGLATHRQVVQRGV